MNKSIHFSGQPILSQLVNLLPKQKIRRVIAEYNTDYYTKRFSTWDHLMTMLFASFTKCSGLREVCCGLSGFSKRMLSVGLRHLVPRSTLADANMRRNWQVFEAIFKVSYLHLRSFLPDSRSKNEGWLHKLLLIDSSTISLFKEILKAAGRTPANGKRKGGVKVHVGMRLSEGVAGLVRITSASTHDVTFLRYLEGVEKGTILVFDKAYVDYRLFNQWTKAGVFWVSRRKASCVVTVLKERKVGVKQKAQGVLSDQVVVLGHDGQEEKVRCRLITFYDAQKDRTFEFVTNDWHKQAYTICQIYKQRWQIELLFKRLKQNLQLNNFLGDNENAIRIQIWCNLLADLLIAVAKARTARKWAYSNVAGIIRIHLMNYVDLSKLLAHPTNASIFWDRVPTYQLELNIRGG